MRSKPTTWQLTDEFRGTEVEKKFPGLDEVVACKGEVISRDRISHVKRVSFAGKCYYVKIYKAAGKRLRRFWGRSAVMWEQKNLQTLRSFGIPTAKIVGYGEERIIGFYRCGALITEEVENSLDLHSFAQKYPEKFREKAWLHAVIRQLACYTRSMHRMGFAHNDLNWRNILVTKEETPKIFFIDCPNGRFLRGSLQQRKITRDLAHLDKIGREMVSRTNLLRFYKYYMAQERLSEEDKRFISRIVRFHDKHRERKRKRLLA